MIFCLEIEVQGHVAVLYETTYRPNQSAKKSEGAVSPPRVVEDLKVHLFVPSRAPNFDF